MLDNNSNKINLINESTLSNQIADLPETIQRTGFSGYRYFSIIYILKIISNKYFLINEVLFDRI